MTTSVMPAPALSIVARTLNTYTVRRFPYTSLALTLALVVLVLGLIWHIDVFDLPGASVIGLEHSEVGEVAIVFVLIIPAFFLDRVVARQRAHEAELQAEQIRVLRVTMRTVQDIVSNALMSLYLFRMEAEPSVSPQSLKLFDEIVADTAAKLKAIGDLEHFAETPMVMGMGIDYESSPQQGN
jgi:fumarate reductase subunit D